MSRTVTLITIFLASPSDVSHEREVVTRVVAEWNARHGRDRSVNFDLLKYETSVSAGFGEDGQNVINGQIGDEYDLLIALFWKRIGSETPRARSGTVEEYERAFARFKADRSVEIAFFFKDAPVNFREDDLEQLASVKKFENDVQNAGALSKIFRDDDSLCFEINLLLDRIARESLSVLNRDLKSSSTSIILKHEAVGDLDDHGDDDECDEENGLLDYLDNLKTHSNGATKFLTSMSEKMNILNESMDKSVEEVNRISSVRSAIIYLS